MTTVPIGDQVQGEEKVIKVLTEEGMDTDTSPKKGGTERLYAIHVEENDTSHGSVLKELRDSRCYNCGSFGHGVRSCPKPPTGNPLN